jgi:hypothetical protein
MIVDPVTPARAKIGEALEVMARYKSSGVPVVNDRGKLVGILTNRDLRFETRTDRPISARMTKKNLITTPVGTTLEQAKELLHKYRIEKLLVVDRAGNLKGLITVKDIQKAIKYPNAAKDGLGRLRVGAAIGVTKDILDRSRELVRAKVDVLVLDSSHGHSQGVLDALRLVRKRFPSTPIIAGNVAIEAARGTSSAAALMRSGRTGPDRSARRGSSRAPACLGSTRSANAPAPPTAPAYPDRRRRHQVLRGHLQGDRGGRAHQTVALAGTESLRARRSCTRAGRSRPTAAWALAAMKAGSSTRTRVHGNRGPPTVASKLVPKASRHGSVQVERRGARPPAHRRPAQRMD